MTRKPWIMGKKWLPNMDLNHDKQIQSLLCYRYTIRQTVGVIFIESDFGVKPSGRVFIESLPIWALI
jgi:hypothetical protein